MSPNIPLPSDGARGEGTDHTATATCFCAAVQLSFPTEGPGLVTTLTCHCSDCHKISASMFTSVFIVSEDSVNHVRGQDTLTRFSGKPRSLSGSKMTNSFCSVCGSLMYRTSTKFPGQLFMRIGTVDDFNLHTTKLKPQIEIFTKNREDWLKAGEGLLQCDGDYFADWKAPWEE
ncbi:hypothetical protein M409DRAFT_36621 [Zasmidium cellare ATCC 36951]|uniref:CENP-V/GFA domain-containing protein n=1 Tax=Zasmidium cellare ATCC 36951 TaxID=1080233 RepID=A0A6A6CIS0_ZASCE|nr:uncharacterized protein M409DRAFT_36621 [Zasmidium cellare ATCC 36951]KAF2167137.1 hypothetical protein M409DRAFT_36621 [Zasmidium cellare ATCC 36951]